MNPTCLACRSAKTAAFFEGPLDKFTRAMGRAAGVAYWLCEDCGIAFQHPLFSDEDYRRFYEGVQRSKATGYDDSAVPASHLAKKARDTAAKWALLKVLGLEEAVRGKRVFEIGPAEGTFLKSFADRGFEVRGIEPFDRYATHAREVFSLDVETGYFKPGSVAPGSADLVVIDNVLEHLMDPAEALREIHSVLAPNGLLLILVPCWEHVYAPQANIAHLTLWSRRALVKSLASAGFAPLSVSWGRPVAAPHEWVALAQRSDSPPTVADVPVPGIRAAQERWRAGVARYQQQLRWQARLGPAYPLAVKAYAGLRWARQIGSGAR